MRCVWAERHEGQGTSASRTSSHQNESWSGWKEVKTIFFGGREIG